MHKNGIAQDSANDNKSAENRLANYTARRQNGGATSLCDCDQRLAFLYALSCGDVDFGNRTRPVGIDGGAHLHGFERYEQVARLYRLAFLNVDCNDRRREGACNVACACRRGSSRFWSGSGRGSYGSRRNGCGSSGGYRRRGRVPRSTSRELRLLLRILCLQL